MVRQKKMIVETLDEAVEVNSPGMAARVAAVKAHPKGKPLDEYGREVPDSTPVAPPIGYIKQPSLFEQVRQMVTQHQKDLAEAGMETLEEFEDLDIPDDEEFDPTSEYENDGDPSIRDLDAAVAEHRKAATAPKEPAEPAPPQPPAEPAGSSS